MDDAAEMSPRRDTSPDHRKLLDDIASMNIGDIERQRAANAYLDALIRAIECRPIRQGGGVSR